MAAMKRTAGVERVLVTPRMAAYADGLRTSAAECATLVARLRKGRSVLVQMDPENPAQGAPDRAQMEELWRDLTMALYRTLRDAYARYALMRQINDDGEAISLWDSLMPNTDDLRKLGVHGLFAHFRGRMEPPQWMTDAECRCVTQMRWLPERGEDIFDAGVDVMVGEIPF